MTSVHAPGTTTLDVYELACLAGGPRRVAEAAVVALAESGRLRVLVPSGELQVVAHRPRHPVEAAVLHAVAGRGHRSLETVAWRLRSDERVVGLVAGLSARGLLVQRPVSRWRPGRSLTTAGRRELRAVRRSLPVDLVAGGTSALLVALRGPAAMPDVEERAALFHPPRSRAPRRVLAWGRPGDGQGRTPGAVYFAGGGSSWDLGGGVGDGGCGDGGGGC
ncbi:TIGR04222 domain-containing membrane protein [Blastococcus sp. TF02A-30]|uniref:TIGR04222 domain-containing membrane protein n=1 Tax=Blastococcus sp. TF02A-30 TaxID=2250580 RepID=UPI000DE9B58B|nr:TIGR04222 domain-containing membrane protein [Blastococcus sp. TF02A-30]RBY83488.1 hypothetical protein DQ241_19660 [Blastococcus sp. TF02A-30]